MPKKLSTFKIISIKKEERMGEEGKEKLQKEKWDRTVNSNEPARWNRIDESCKPKKRRLEQKQKAFPYIYRPNVYEPQQQVQPMHNYYNYGTFAVYSPYQHGIPLQVRPVSYGTSFVHSKQQQLFRQQLFQQQPPPQQQPPQQQQLQQRQQQQQLFQQKPPPQQQLFQQQPPPLQQLFQQQPPQQQQLQQQQQQQLFQQQPPQQQQFAQQQQQQQFALQQQQDVERLLLQDENLALKAISNAVVAEVERLKDANQAQLTAQTAKHAEELKSISKRLHEPKKPRDALRCFMRRNVRELRKKYPPGTTETKLKHILKEMFQQAPSDVQTQMSRLAEQDKARYEKELADYQYMPFGHNNKCPE